MTANYPSVAIAILNWNGLHFLEALLPEINRLTYPNYKVYVIDNKSTDQSITYIEECHPNIKIIALNDNYGFAGGYNRGLAAIEEDYYLMMNSDVEVPKWFLEPMVEMMEEDRSIAICQPKLLALQQPHMLEHGGAAGGMIDFLGYPMCRGRLFDKCEKDNGQFDVKTPIFWSSGACSLIRKEAYRQVNGMYEYYFMHSEEIDLCWRLIVNDWKIMYCPHSYIYHLGGGTLSYHTPRKTYLNFRNNIVMCFRNSPWYINLWLLPLRMFLDLCASLMFLVKEDNANFKAVFRAYWHFFAWLFTEKDKFPQKKKSLLAIPFVYKKSVAWQYYINKKHSYSQL